MYISPARVDRLLAGSPNLSAWAPRVFVLLAVRVFPPLRESRTITQLEIVTMALWYHGAKMAKSQFWVSSSYKYDYTQPLHRLLSPFLSFLSVLLHFGL